MMDYKKRKLKKDLERAQEQAKLGYFENAPDIQDYLKDAITRLDDGQFEELKENTKLKIILSQSWVIYKDKRDFGRDLRSAIYFAKEGHFKDEQVLETLNQAIEDYDNGNYEEQKKNEKLLKILEESEAIDCRITKEREHELEETQKNLPSYFKREDIPLYLGYESIHQITTRLTNDSDELIYCLLLWSREAESRCFPNVAERHMVQKVHEGKISHTTIETDGETEEVYIPKVSTVEQHLDCGEMSEEDKRKTILAGDDYSEILEYCNRLFQKLTLFFVRHAATRGLVLNRIWDFYLSTVDSDYPESHCGDFIYAAGGYCYFSTDAEFRETVQLEIMESFRRAMAEMEMLAVTVHTNITLNYFLSFSYSGNQGDKSELKGTTFTKPQIIKMTGLSASTILGYEKDLIERQCETGVPERDQFKRAGRGKKNHKYKKRDVIDLLNFIRDNNKEPEIVDNCQQSLNDLNGRKSQITD
ncbi:hypothetical protein [Gimesia maris]|uniref:hypothetical protein n=1 Tax=Gimesia maris TaxID=122 RepID=UPI0012B9A953|nr:hypothetical protein [Gimesia maris]